MKFKKEIFPKEGESDEEKKLGEIDYPNLHGKTTDEYGELINPEPLEDTEKEIDQDTAKKFETKYSDEHGRRKIEILGELGEPGEPGKESDYSKGITAAERIEELRKRECGDSNNGK